MRYIILMLMGVSSSLIMHSCVNKELENNVLSHQDSLHILGNSLSYILKHTELPDEFSSSSLQIVPSEVVAIDSSLQIQKHTFLLLPKDVKVSQIVSRLTVLKPTPLVEVLKFGVINGQMQIQIAFRTTGHLFEVTVDKNHKVIDVEESTI